MMFSKEVGTLVVAKIERTGYRISCLSLSVVNEHRREICFVAMKMGATGANSGGIGNRHGTEKKSRMRHDHLVNFHYE